MTRMGQVAEELERNAWLHDVVCMYKVLTGAGGDMRRSRARVRTADFVKANHARWCYPQTRGKVGRKKHFTLDTNILSFHGYSEAFVDLDSKDYCIIEKTIFI